MLHTTFKLARKAGACAESYGKFAKHVGGIKKYGADTPIPLTDILDVLGLNDTLWVMRYTIEDYKGLAQLFTCDCAERTLHIFEKKYPNDTRPRSAVEVARKYANGEATDEELAAAWAAAWDAAWAAGDAAWAATWAAAWAAGDAGDAKREWQINRLREMLNEHTV